MLEPPIKTRNARAVEDLNDVRDQMYWQTVSCLLLGNMKSQKAVPALLKVVITPFKGVQGSRDRIDIPVECVHDRWAGLFFAADQLSEQGLEIVAEGLDGLKAHHP